MRTILCTVLLLAAVPASADWLKVTQTTDTVYYVDPVSVRDIGEFRHVSVIHDYATPEPGGLRSRQVSYEIDCAGERLRSVAVTEYPEPMAQGKAVSSRASTSEWAYVGPRTGSNIPPQTPYRPILRFVCAR